MLSFLAGDTRFQVRAAAVIRHAGHVLLHRAQGDEFWTFPGGRVEFGEDTATTVVRELQEELGITVACERLLCVVEYFFDHRGLRNHELGFFFTATLPASCELMDTTRSHIGREGHLALEFRWIPEADLPRVNVYPLSLKTAPLVAGPTPLHFVEREGD
jgi:mutator protein MutT